MDILEGIKRLAKSEDDADPRGVGMPRFNRRRSKDRKTRGSGPENSSPRWGAAVKVSAAIIVFAVAVSFIDIPYRELPPMPATFAPVYLLKIDYTYIIQEFDAPDRCDIGRQFVENLRDNIPDGAVRTVKCEEVKP
jgi:hypothetical protein